MVKVVKIWKGDLMMRSKSLAKNKDLQRKVLCSLLAAGVMSVCISGGDVWAAGNDLAAQGVSKTYSSTDVVGVLKVIGGWDSYKDNVGMLDHSGQTTSVTISSGTFDELIGGNHIKQPGSEIYNVTIGDTSVQLDGGEVQYVIGGSKANNSDDTTLTTGNTNVLINKGTVKGMVIGGSYIKATGNPRGGTPAVTTAATGATNVVISGGTVKGNVYAGSVADNYSSKQTDAKPALHVTDKNTSLNISGGAFNGKKVYGGGSAVGEGSTSVAGDTSVIITAAGTDIDCVYGGGYAEKGGKVTAGNTHIVIDIESNGAGVEDIFGGNSVYAYPGGVNAQGIVGDTLIEYKNGTSRGMLFGGSEIMGYSAKTNDESKIETGNTKVMVTGGTLTEAVLGGSKVPLTGDQGNKVSSIGQDTNITVSGDTTSVKGLVGGDLVQVLNKNYSSDVRIAEGKVNNTNIIINGGTINSLYVDSSASIQIGDVNFKGAIIGGGVATGGTDDNKHAESRVDTTNVVINAGTINGDIYGGGLSTATLRSGNEADGGSSLVNSANVTIKGGTVNGDIYGGGAAVGAGVYTGGSSSVENSAVNITGGTINGYVYGGGLNASVKGDLQVTLNNVYTGKYDKKTGAFGASFITGEKLHIIDGNVTIEVSDSHLYADIRGGSDNEGSDNISEMGNSKVVVSNSQLNGNDAQGGIYPGRIFGAGYVQGKNDVTDHKSAEVILNNVAGITYDKVTGNAVYEPGARIYGGGQVYNATKSLLNVGSTKVIINGAATALEEVYGGSIISGTVKKEDLSVAVTEKTDVVVNDGLIASMLVGGNNTNWFGTSVIGSVAADGKYDYNGKKYNGGSTEVELNGGGSDTLSVVGGSLSDYSSYSDQGSKRESMVFGTTTVNVNGGKMYEVVGGGYAYYSAESVDESKLNDAAPLSNVVGATTVNISGGTILDNVYGGGYAYSNQKLMASQANITGDVNVNISGGTITGAVYAGGGAIGDNTQANVSGKATVNISGGTITGGVYGHGYTKGADASATVGSSGLNIKDYAGTIKEISGFDAVDIVDSTLTTALRASSKGTVVILSGAGSSLQGTLTADNAELNLGGADDVYNVGKLITENSGTITVSGGTLNIDNLSDINKFDLADNSLIVTGKGILQGTSGNLFDKNGTVAVKSAVDVKVLFNGGKLAISDASYTLADSKVYSEALGKVDDSGAGAKAKTTIVMTGTLQDQPVDNKATVDDLAPTGAVHTNVTGTVSTGTLNVGDGTSSEGATGVNNDLGVKDLDFSTNSGSGTVNANVTISNDTGLTLVGDGSSELLKGTGNSNNTVTVGSGSAGTLTLGNAAAESSGGTLNAAVTLQADSQMNVEAGSFTVGKITAAEGTVAVNAGANLTTTQDFTVGDASSNKSGTIDAAGSITAGKVDLQQGTVAVTGSLTANELSVGDSSNSKEGAVTAAGTVDVDTLNLNKGKVEVTGSLTAKTLTVVDSDAKIAVGAADSAGTLTAEDVKLGGASLMLDPAWEDSSTIQTASKAGLKFNSSQIDGKLTVGQNSVLSLGTADTAKAEAAFTDTGLTWGKNDITAALYIDYEQTMDSTKGGIKVDGSLTHASDNKDLAAANTATFAAGSLLMVAGDAALTTDGALKAGSTVNAQNNGNSNNDAATLKVDSGAKLYIADAQADKQYTIVSGFTNSGSAVTDGGWNGTNLLLNKLVKGSGSYSNGSFTVSTQKVKASTALPGVALPNILDAMRSQTDSTYAGIKYLSNAISGLNSNAQTLAAVNSFAQGAENSGATRTGALAAMDLGTAAQEHLSLAKAAAEQSGGFGKAAVDTADNGSIWAQYIHNKDKVDNMGGVSYDGQYNGVIIGGDFADRGKYSSGMAFSYGSGDSTGSASKNEFDFWGLSYYGGIQNGDTNLIFDVGYSKTSSDVKGVIKAEPDTQVISMGIKGEKLISNGHGTSYVPYAGLRYMNIDTDSYNGSIDGKTAAHYSTDKADLWLLPVGISISHESVTAGGWKVRPTADIAYVWTLGDKNTAMDITVPGVNATDRLGYDIMDSGFFVGKLGLEAEKGDWTYGLGYACQKGSHAQNSKFMLNVTYSF